MTALIAALVLTAGCAGDAYRQLDFWVGAWDVRLADGTAVGTNTIETILGGCGLLEHWRDGRGGEGKSLFYVDPARAAWKQVWVTDSGPIKEKRMVPAPAPAVRFQGEVTRGAATVLDRTTLTPLPDGRVRQTIEQSADEGATWQATFDAFYSRRKGASAAAREGRVLSCAAPLAPDATAASLTAHFGAGNVAVEEINIGEGDTERGTVLFPASAEERVEILWFDRDRQARPRAVFVRGAPDDASRTSRWRSPRGLAIGMPLRDVERLNGKPFRLLGFGWDYAGTVSSWSGGRLGSDQPPGCTLRARLSPTTFAGDRIHDTPLQQVIGDREFSSGHPAMQQIQPLVYEMFLEYDPVRQAGARD